MKARHYLLSSILLLLSVYIINVFVIGREGHSAVIAVLGSFTIAVLLREFFLSLFLD